MKFFKTLIKISAVLSVPIAVIPLLFLFLFFLKSSAYFPLFFIVPFFFIMLFQQIMAAKKYLTNIKVVFPNAILESDEVILYQLNNVWAKTSSNAFLLWSFSLDKIFISITNKRVVLAGSFFGVVKYTKDWGNMWFDNNRKESWYKFGNIVDVFFLDGNEPALILKGSRLNAKWKIYTNDAEAIYKKLKPLINK